jgi:hypothetical protein
MRPDQPWGDVVQVLNRRGSGQAWTAQRLRRAVHRLASEGIVEPGLLGSAGRRPADDRLVAVVAGIVLAAPAMTLQQVASQLEAMHERTPRGGTRWHPSSVRNLLRQAQRRGLLGPGAEPQGPAAR